LLEYQKPNTPIQLYKKTAPAQSTFSASNTKGHEKNF